MVETSQARWVLGVAAGVIGVALAILGLYEITRNGATATSRRATIASPRGYVLTIERETGW